VLGLSTIEFSSVLAHSLALPTSTTHASELDDATCQCVRDLTPSIYVTKHIHLSDMTPSYVHHDTFNLSRIIRVHMGITQTYTPYTNITHTATRIVTRPNTNFDTLYCHLPMHLAESARRRLTSTTITSHRRHARPMIMPTHILIALYAMMRRHLFS